MRRRLGQMERRDLIAYIRELEDQVMLGNRLSPHELEETIFKALVRFEEYKQEKVNEKNARYLKAQIDYAVQEAKAKAAAHRRLYRGES